MTIAMNALRKLVRSRRAGNVQLDARTLRDIGLSWIVAEFGAIG